MKIEVLGSGGAVTVPRAFCDCRVCTQAKDNPRPPYVRHGPSVYIHDLDLLIDTPEEIRIQLNRSGIDSVGTVLYTHWHPDHTAGIRVFEGNYTVASLLDPDKRPRRTRVVLPHRVARTFEQYHALEEKLAYLEQFGLVTIDRVAAGTPFEVHGWRITPVPLAEEIAVAYLLDEQRRVFICMDEAFGYEPNDLGSLDLAILPCGFFHRHPLTGEPLIAENHPVIQREPTYEDMLDVARTIGAARVIFLHLNHGLGLTPDEFEVLAGRVSQDRTLPPIEFAFDTMRITV
ncbi:MAG: MBL fold metallo-hydrolase [Spirochaetia bacterium]